MKRGDVILVRFPHPSGLRGKKRPAVIVQSDANAGTVSTLVVAEVTKNLTMANDPACLFIDTSTPEGAGDGPGSRFHCVLSGACDRVRGCGHPRTGNAFAGHETKARRLSESGARLAVTPNRYMASLYQSGVRLNRSARSFHWSGDTFRSKSFVFRASP